MAQPVRERGQRMRLWRGVRTGIWTVTAGSVLLLAAARPLRAASCTTQAELPAQDRAALAALWGGNFLRVMRLAEDAAD